MGGHRENDNRPAKLLRATSQISESDKQFENTDSATALISQTENNTSRSKTKTESRNDKNSSQCIKTDPNDEQNTEETRVEIKDADIKDVSHGVNKSASKRNQNSPLSCRRVCLFFITTVVTSIVSSVFTANIYLNRYFPNQTTTDNGFPETSASRYTSTGSRMFAQFSIDQLTLKDEGKIVWENRESLVPSDAFVADRNGCVLVKRSGVYVLVSKVTFEYYKMSPIASLFHALILQKVSNERDVLENSPLQLLRKENRPRRVTRASTITSLQTIQAGDSLCIGVPDAKWLYISPSANTLKIFRLAG